MRLSLSMIFSKVLNLRMASSLLQEANVNRNWFLTLFMSFYVFFPVGFLTLANSTAWRMNASVGVDSLIGFFGELGAHEDDDPSETCWNVGLSPLLSLSSSLSSSNHSSTYSSMTSSVMSSSSRFSSSRQAPSRSGTFVCKHSRSSILLLQSQLLAIPIGKGLLNYLYNHTLHKGAFYTLSIEFCRLLLLSLYLTSCKFFIYWSIYFKVYT